MKKYIEILRRCRLFEDIDSEDILGMLGCLGASVRRFSRNQTIFSEAEKPVFIGILLSGTVQLLQTDYYGNRSILSEIRPAQVFGESFVCADVQMYPVNAVASDECEVMLLDGKRITCSCCNACQFHSRIIFNLMRVLAEKNIILSRKIRITSKRTTREKLMEYLLLQAKEQGSSSFSVPFDRQELADYLEVDRSGLSAEISKLRKENIIECRKNQFRLIK